MRGILRRLLESRVVWFIALFFWISLTIRCWGKVAVETFEPIRIVTAVLATALTGFVTLIFFLNRGWRKDADDSQPGSSGRS